ncbi:MAG: hypothetical protein Q8R46_10960 [Nitrosomonas sp.]|uniref:hypothetical protein n=1 Tax=Nitrosomonas sp. TaxID=42353 RepID=UPI00273510FA|nr:hypothetical protein [Nitrosomonas sp.]MDP3663906.1 hypothetical protein [Nitrosomonas sp.]
MKSLSEIAVPAITRREVLVNYFSNHSHVPYLAPDQTYKVDINLGGVFKNDHLVLTYTYDEVMHVLAEMKLRGLPYTSYEQMQEMRDQELRAQIAVEQFKLDKMARVEKEIAATIGLGETDLGRMVHDDKVDSSSWMQRAMSKLFP